MNDLQQILLVFAVILVVGLYFFSRQKTNDETKKDKKQPTIQPAETADDVGIEPSARFNAQAMPEETPSTSIEADTSPTQLTEQITQTEVEQLDDENYVPDTQEKLPFGDEFKLEPQPYKVIELDDMVHESEVQTPKEPVELEPQIFAILVLSSNKEFTMQRVSKVLEDSELIFSDRGTFVKKYGDKVVLQVANIMEPGTFPSDPNSQITTPGIALILELPTTTIKELAAMDDLIMTARRVSQNLKGRMYDMQRHLIRESDLQAMREVAMDFESKKAADVRR